MLGRLRWWYPPAPVLGVLTYYLSYLLCVGNKLNRCPNGEMSQFSDMLEFLPRPLLPTHNFLSSAANSARFLEFIVPDLQVVADL